MGNGKFGLGRAAAYLERERRDANNAPVWLSGILVYWYGGVGKIIILERQL